MTIVDLPGQYKIYDDIAELGAQDQELVELAIAQLEHSYAPYSQFHVGAATRLVDGSVYLGCNQENASYPLCICGERVALYNAGVYKPKVAVATLAITVKNLKMKCEGPISPCGACRQVIAEFESRHNHAIRILLKSDGKEVYEVDSISTLLPLGFSGIFL